MTMTPDELSTLHKYMNTASIFLEFGAGESTIHAARLESIRQIDSIESSASFVNERLKINHDIQNAIESGKLIFHIIEIGETRSWGHPTDKSKKQLWPNYSSAIFTRPGEHDLVLVDGRFRVACTLNAILYTKDDCKIIIHDFWNRPQYHIVLKYLDLIEKSDTLGVFSKKKILDTNEIKNLIGKYQYLPHDKTFMFKVKEKLKKRLGIK